MSDYCTAFVYMYTIVHNYKMLVGGEWTERKWKLQTKTFAVKENKNMSGRSAETGLRVFVWFVGGFFKSSPKNIFRERERRETLISCLPITCPDQGTNSQHRYVP